MEDEKKNHILQIIDGELVQGFDEIVGYLHENPKQSNQEVQTV